MTPLVKRLVEQIDELLEALQRANLKIQHMRDEIAVLKGEKAKPKFKSSKMDQSTDKDQKAGDDEGASPQDGDKVKRAGSARATCLRRSIQHPRITEIHHDVGASYSAPV